jgi:membrane protease YdiL (CAAX protease family)
MNSIAAFVKSQALAIFCALTIALSFAATQLPLPGEVVPVVMVFVPALIALSLTAMTEGWAGVWALESKLGQWRVRRKWIIIALALGLVMRLTMSVVALLLGLIPAMGLRPWTPVQMAMFALILFIFALPEELGWRGYVLPKLLTAHSPLVTGLIIGVVWGSLHLALTLPGMINAGAPPLPTLLGLIGLSVLATWLYIGSGGNLLLTSLFHAAQSFFVLVNEGIPLEQQAWLMASVYMVTALIIAIVAGPRFARKPTAPVATRPGREDGQSIEAAPTAHAAARTSFGDEHHIA